jgi:hypothetical protein
MPYTQTVRSGSRMATQYRAGQASLSMAGRARAGCSHDAGGTPTLRCSTYCRNSTRVPLSLPRRHARIAVRETVSPALPGAEEIVP